MIGDECEVGEFATSHESIIISFHIVYFSSYCHRELDFLFLYFQVECDVIVYMENVNFSLNIVYLRIKCSELSSLGMEKSAVL